MDMAKKKKKSNENESYCQKYGAPIYGAAWIPTKTLFSSIQDESTSSSWVVFCGGGGDGKSWIPNLLLLVEFDSTSNSLSPNPVAKLGTGAYLPYRMAVHPGGEGVICSFPKSCRWFDWDVPETTEAHKLDLKSSEKILTQLEDVGQQLAMTFSSDGSALAVGGVDGHLRVFKWPSMEIILDHVEIILDQVDDANATLRKAEKIIEVKYLNFSSDGKILVSLGSRCPGRVWDVSSSKIVASLPNESDEDFGFCQFSRTKDNRQILYITANRARGGSIISWDTTSWKRIGSKQIVRDSISAFNVSTDGELLAIGTNEGDIYILNSSMRVRTVIKRAHLVVVTVLIFSNDSRSLLSASLDSSARVTLIENNKKQKGLSLWVVRFIILLAMLGYLLKSRIVI